MHEHTQTPWRIDKQAPGTDDSSLNKQPPLCLLHPTPPHPFPHIPLHLCTQTHTKTTVEYMKTLVSRFIGSYLNRAPHMNLEGHKTIRVRVLSFSHISSPGLTLGNTSADSHSCAVSVFQSSAWTQCPFLLTAQELHWYDARGFFGCVEADRVDIQCVWGEKKYSSSYRATEMTVLPIHGSYIRL